VLGRKIQLVVEDNKSNPTEAVATAEKLIGKDKVPVMMGAWSSTLTLAVMPKLMEYGVPMLVETSSSGKITTSGNPWIFRISPTSEMEAKAFAPMVKPLGIKKADFLSTNNDFGLGAVKEFSEMLKGQGVQVGVMETMDPKATDLSAQLAKIKASGGDTLFVTTAVEQITLILKQAREQRLKAHHHHWRFELAGSADPAGGRCGQRLPALGVLHALVSGGGQEPGSRQEVRGRMERSQVRRGRPYRGFPRLGRHHDDRRGDQGGGGGRAAGDQTALWNVKVKGINGDIAFIKQGPAGKESGQNVPSVYAVKIENGKVVRN
jgi:branched-chain amino acid transport system substrate-binding protein